MCFNHKDITFYKISDYGRCYSVYEALYYLDNYGPLPFSTYYYEPSDRFDLDKSWISKTDQEESSSKSSSNSNKDQETHCMLFIGYTDQAFICRNSWGPDFGTDGCIEFLFSEFKYIVDIFWVK